MLLHISKDQIMAIDIPRVHDLILVIGDKMTNAGDHQPIPFSGKEYKRLITQAPDTLAVVIIAAADNFDPDHLKATLSQLVGQTMNADAAILLPYFPPPIISHIDYGPARSFAIMNRDCFSAIPIKLIEQNDLETLIYTFTYKYLNSDRTDLKIIQVGKTNQSGKQRPTKKLRHSLLVIPHKGRIDLLNRCLSSLEATDALPSRINLCFDDSSFKKMNLNMFNKIAGRISILKNKPGNRGPYLARHFSAVQTDKEYIFFQDSDDISTKDRFSIQMNELLQRGLDMIGSHELRIDQILKKVMIRRFPWDVTRALSWKDGFHSLFHPTSLISKKAYLQTGGFSTDRSFGYDTQFLLRSYFFLKSGNCDDFLYIRFRRPNSITTSEKTGLNSNFRNFLLTRWRTDFRLIREGCLDLAESSLKVWRHKFAFTFIKINKRNSN
ncbi:glycosyltransferase [Flavitalea sp. BT771]|uniref:glycosyltransferase n=1 Tax=Flavitalea sp. BT771 TaxID=3063329 RepID=UPI0026E12AE2|nr:glycosyltransferase [Flavitalea sp. BT771]MDO6434793.1 glycosyltransferase [Flavitalea sp. BT771]MDV6223693.1 glycosyltransferase [Flavitalea sp. BT771]